MSAEVLRRAAARMRRDAERATPGPYGMTSAWTTPNTMLSRVTHKGGVVAEVRGRDGDGHGVMTVNYFSSWHPAVALAVADLLDRLADDREADPYLPKCFDEAALTVARAYLGDAR